MKTVFAGVSALPKAKRHGKRTAPASNPSGLVGRLVEKCADMNADPRVVGIDLTGSEKRATGWALMEGVET